MILLEVGMVKVEKKSNGKHLSSSLLLPKSDISTNFYENVSEKSPNLFGEYKRWAYKELKYVY